MFQRAGILGIRITGNHVVKQWMMISYRGYSSSSSTSKDNIKTEPSPLNSKVEVPVKDTSNSPSFTSDVKRFIRSTSQAMINMIPVVRIKSSEVMLVKVKNEEKAKILNQGWHICFGSEVYRGQLKNNLVYIDGLPCLTKDFVTLLVSTNISWNANSIEKLSTFDGNVNQWLKNQFSYKISRHFKQRDIIDVLGNTTSLEDDLRKSINSTIGKYGLECDYVTFEIIPPPKLTETFENAASEKFYLENEKNQESHSLKLLQERNRIKREEVSKLMMIYTDTLKTLSQNLKSEESKEAAKLLSDPNFFRSIQNVVDNVETKTRKSSAVDEIFHKES